LNKIYITLYLLLFGLTLIGQTNQTSSNGFGYDVLQANDVDRFSDESGTLDLSQTAVSTTVSVDQKKSDFINLPFYGLVKLRNEYITHLSIVDPIKKYNSNEIRLSKPIGLTIPSEGPLVSEYTLVLGPDELKSSLLNQLPIRPDSVRVRVLLELNDEPQGTVSIKRKDKTTSASSFSRTVNVNRSVEIKIEPFGWESVSEIAPMIDWDKNYSYTQKIYTDSEFRLPIAMTEQRDGISKAAVLSESKNGVSGKTTSGYPTITAVPNPAINDLRFEVDNVNPGTYTIRIKNILGELKIEKRVTMDSSEIIPVDIDSLRKGSYFYILEDDDGNVLSTKRLIVLRP